MRNQAKEIEEFYLRLLQKAFPSLPQGQPTRSESPDFILLTNAGQVGVEVTRLFKSPDSQGRHLQAQENERSLMVMEAMRLYEASGNPPVEIHVHMAAQTEFNKKNRRHFAQTLSRLVGLHVPPDRSWTVIENDFEKPDLFPFEFDSISIARFGHKRNYWNVPDGGWVQEHFMAELQSVINKKNALLTQFDSSCSMHWLLIVIEGVSGSTLFEPSHETLNHVYTADFQKVFLLERLTGNGYELRLGAA